VAARSNCAKSRESKSHSHFSNGRRLKGSPGILRRLPHSSESVSAGKRDSRGLQADRFNSTRFPLRVLLPATFVRTLVQFTSLVKSLSLVCDLIRFAACCYGEWELEIDETKQVEEEKRWTLDGP